MRVKWNAHVLFRFSRVIGTEWHLQRGPAGRSGLPAGHGVHAAFLIAAVSHRPQQRAVNEAADRKMANFELPQV